MARQTSLAFVGLLAKLSFDPFYFHPGIVRKTQFSAIAKIATSLLQSHCVYRNVRIAMEPAHGIITKCGEGDFTRGVRIVAEVTGVDRSSVHRWTYPKTRGGTDGLVPSQHQPVLLEKMRKRGITLRPADFFDTPLAESPRASAPKRRKAA